MMEPTMCQAADQTKIAEVEYKVKWGVIQSQTEVAQDWSGLGENCGQEWTNTRAQPADHLVNIWGDQLQGMDDDGQKVWLLY